jgi:hypothetical protein
VCFVVPGKAALFQSQTVDSNHNAKPRADSP